VRSERNPHDAPAAHGDRDAAGDIGELQDVIHMTDGTVIGC
jgi:hypothetical protein